MTIDTSTIEIIEADLTVPEHALAVINLMDEYASDPMGGSSGLSDFAKNHLISELAKRKTSYVILAFVERKPAGLIICFERFSTFACQPLLNIHDAIVSLPYRGLGLSKLMLQCAEQIAIDLGCCKLTLEVLEHNYIAQKAYRSFGFDGYALDPKMGKALFWEKKL
ncbi:GNAT family N-acetyltransferase [Chamaesiphon polymorphus]|uniref:GNAT family N-acetyltransferase n=1 Tax=Chamaesiphon polymorphus CCALA 037 TaxID=2107692 RepID=A0A2T1G130_9CYAN|nr:GNAT family N-acetyltransferase [Chamaesiphon polymorphus]PSB50953.1 GNAT family N-acetyltransferase [Chamaesiphon polymorphus CCALA 037]